VLYRVHEWSDSPATCENLTASAEVVDVLYSGGAQAILIRTRLKHAEQSGVRFRGHGPNRPNAKAWHVSDATQLRIQVRYPTVFEGTLRLKH